MWKPFLIALCLVVACDKKEPPKKDRLEEYGDQLAAELKKDVGKAVKESGKAVDTAKAVSDDADKVTDEAKQAMLAKLGDSTDKLADGLAGLDAVDAKAGGKDGRCVDGRCKQTCAPTKTCDFTCSGGNCTQVCEKDSKCEASCSGNNCTQTCAAGATCQFTCSGGGCTQKCDGPCKKSCTGNGCK